MIRVRSTERVVPLVPDFSRLSGPWKEEKGESSLLVSRGDESMLGVIQRPLMATWAGALGIRPGMGQPLG